LTVPNRIGDWWYYSRMVPGGQYPIFYRYPALHEGDEVVRVVTKSEIGDLLERNRAFYALLRNGVPVSYRVDGEAQTRQAMLVDFENPQANSFIAVNQLEIRGTRGKRIPDVILFVNGLPLVVMELKHPLNEKADLQAAFNQLQTYKAEIGDLFVFNQLLLVSDGVNARIGSLSADWQRFMPWRVVDEAAGSARLSFEDELEGVVQSLLRPDTLLDYVRFFVLFERDGRGQTVCARWHSRCARWRRSRWLAESCKSRCSNSARFAARQRGFRPNRR